MLEDEGGQTFLKIHERERGLMLQGHEDRDHVPAILGGKAAFRFIDDHEDFSVWSLMGECFAVAAGIVDEFAQRVREEMFRGQKVGLCIVARPARDDGLVIDMACPFLRVAVVAADVIVNVVAIGVDGISGRVADVETDRAHEVGDAEGGRFPRDDGTGEEDFVRPHGALDLAVGVRFCGQGFVENAVGDLVAELVGMAAEDGFGGTDHDGRFWGRGGRVV